MRRGLRGVELSQLSNAVHGVAGYARVAELRRDEVCNICMVVCTFEILGDFSKLTTPHTPEWLNKITLLYELSQR